MIEVWLAHPYRVVFNDILMSNANTLFSNNWDLTNSHYLKFEEEKRLFVLLCIREIHEDCPDY